MSKLTGPRLGGLVFLAAALLVSMPSGAAQTKATIYQAPHVILCGPGLVYRCFPNGCFCVRP